jgi:cell division protein FtsI/penicillin-binding protein 2
LTRIRLISAFVFLFALLIIVRLYFLQIVDHSLYLQKADRQYLSTSGSIFDRGTIYFQDKDGNLISAATLKSGFTVAINPEILQDPESVYQKLNAILPIDHDTFIGKATKADDPYEEIATKVSDDVGQEIGNLKISGLNVYKENWRFYPGDDIASRTIGMMGYIGNNYAGRYGLESEYENTLERTDESDINFFAELFADIKSANSGQSEGDIVTSIEPTVEMELQSELASTTARWSSDYTGGIIMNPSTGEIYAMDISPTFDPNNPQNVTNISTFSNPLVEDVYEMGSIIKPLTMSIGIDTGVMTATTTYDDPGFVMLNGKKVSDFDGKDRGVVTMQTALSQSLNVGAAYAEHLIGNARFTQYMYNFGLNEKTGIDLPNEAKDITSNLEVNRDLEHAEASFGQGIALTPIATIRALAAIANGGLLINPHVVKQINYTVGLSKNIPTVAERRVISQAAAEAVTKMMVWSADNTLMNGTVKLANYSVAVKTGTAQIAKPNGGGYYDDKFLHSFVGFFPAYNPQFIIFLYTYNPQGVQFGSETLTEPFMNLVKFLINYYNIPPDR